MFLDAEMETCFCPLCEADSPLPGGYAHKSYKVVQCGECSTWYLSPRLREEKMFVEYQSADYFQGGETGYSSYHQQEASLRATFRNFLKQLQRRSMTGGDLLEIGCAYGYLLEEAKPYFQFRAGTDFSSAALQEARTRADQVWLGGSEEVPVDRKFDCIIAAHVIEHVYHPRKFVDNLLAHLKPGGSLILAAPDMGSFWRRWMGHKWPSFKYPEHVVYYDAQSLSRLLQQAGLSQLQSIPYPHAFPVGEVLRKLRLPAISLVSGLNAWFPATTVAVGGVLARKIERKAA